MNGTVEKIRNGELDPNNLELFFSKLIKAILLDLTDKVVVKSGHIPHIIYNTGDDIMWLLEKEYDYGREPYEVTNEQYIYSRVPRCTVQPSNFDAEPDQLSSPYAKGLFQIEMDNQLQTLVAETRRMPVKTQLELKYIVNNFREALELMQVIFSRLVFIQTVKFDYLGQIITASYKIPESLQEEHQVEFDGSTQEQKEPKITISIEIETNLPVYEPRTVSEYIPITRPNNNLYIKGNEVNKRDNAPWPSARGAGGW